MSASGAERSTLSHDLNERVKEMRTLSSAAALLVEDHELQIMMQRLIELLPPGWQVPEITCARASYNGQIWTTENFTATEDVLSSAILIDGEKRGELEVFYTKECPAADEGPFIKEERVLLDSVAHLLSAAITRSEARRLSQGVVDTIPALVYIYDMKSNSNIYSNNGVERLFGYTPQQIREMGSELFIKIMHPDDLQNVIAFQSKVSAARDDEVLTIEYRMKNAAGEYRSIVSYERPYLRDSEGNVWHKIGVATDVTDLRQTREAYDKQAARMDKALHELRLKDMVFESSIAAGSIADSQGTITHVNPAFVKLWGYENEEAAIGESVGSFFMNAEDAGPVLEALSTTGKWEGEFLARKQDGSTFMSRGFATVVRNDSGEHIGYQSTNLDVTAEKNAAEALRESEEKFRTLVTDSEEIVYMIDKDGTFLLSEGRGLEAVGVKPGQVVGASVFDLYKDFPDMLEDMRKALAGEKVTNESDVGGVWFRSWYSPYLDRNGEVAGLLGLSVNITEQKRAERQLATKAAELERSNKELEQFAYVASHDLQEPLRMVSSYTQLLGERFKGQLGEKADKWIRYAVDGASRMQRLISDLLSYSRVETRGKKPEETDSHSALGEALGNHADTIEKSGAIVTNDDLPTVQADRSQLVQLFQNIVGNALKFHGERSPHVHVSAKREDGGWVFSVKDNGIGIEKEYFDRIFVIFQRLHTRSAYPGTGIGLAICKRIVERHGGRIWIESQPGKGATFFFTLKGSH